MAIYWLFPYPNTMGLWPQFRSPLIWDVFAVSTYATVSALFWYIGLVPDLATLRDRATSKVARPSSAFSPWLARLGRHWQRYEMAYLLLAGISTPLVLSVHSVVSFDFAVSVLPGWHATIFPPYFVAGAIFSGFAMVMTLAVPLRKFYGLEDFITMRHIHNMTKVMLATGMIVAYGYANEAFFAWYSANPYEGYMMLNRMTGPYAFFYWSLIAINAAMIELFWFRKVRDNVALLFVLSLVVNWGCGSSASSSSSRACTGTSCPRPGTCTTRRGGTLRCLWARSGCSSRSYSLRSLTTGDRHLRDAHHSAGSKAERNRG